ncbi:MAG: 2-oxo acid dehydrogenase subunit E2 [Alphaproteobacteria bacterium]|nr:2-oxo acid dehydrogenase subunit E2 [Alphaproteobacteria bacterium]
MSALFALPDLGEGLAEAEIVAWHVAAGDHVVADQPLVSVETDKAVVEIPSPRSGRIAKLHAERGVRLKVGAALVEFAEGEGRDAGAVVGELPTAPPAAPRPKPITQARPMAEPLAGVRRAMAANMRRSGDEVVPATVLEDADIGDWAATEDVTVRLIRAVAAAVAASPALNVWYDSARQERRLHQKLDLGIAVDTEDGLIVPVMRDVGRRDAADLRRGLDRLIADVRARKVPLAELRDPTLTLSNFGMMAGRYAALSIVPPQVAILGAGRTREEVRAREGAAAVRRVLPLSLTFDHRVVSGGEAARFLSAALTDLERAR